MFATGRVSPAHPNTPKEFQTMKNLISALVLATSFAAFAQDAKPATPPATTDAKASATTSTKTKNGTTTTKKSTTKKSTTTKPAADKPADAAPAK
jgi:hypothetical protein